MPLPDFLKNRYKDWNKTIFQLVRNYIKVLKATDKIKISCDFVL